MTIAQEEIERLRAKHGEVWIFRRGPYEIVFRCPEALEFRRYTIAVAEDRAKLWDAQELLVKHAVVHPDTATLEDILARRPMLLHALADQIGAVAAEEERIDARKL
jgi:hypothetical protein